MERGIWNLRKRWTEILDKETGETLLRWLLRKDLKDVSEPAMWVSRGRTLQAQGTVSMKVLRQELWLISPKNSKKSSVAWVEWMREWVVRKQTKEVTRDQDMQSLAFTFKEMRSHWRVLKRVTYCYLSFNRIILWKDRVY